MYTIIEHIEYLMMSHDCVIIPGWGALVAQYSDSFYNPQAGHIERPQRKLGFNASVNHNDGLLAQSLVRREGIPYTEALRFIGQNVSAFRQQLSQGNEVSMGRLGFFHSDTDGHVEFVPFYHETCSDTYFGLRNVQFRPLIEATRRQDESPVSADGTHRVPARRVSMARRYVQIAASIVLLLCLTVLLTTPIIINREYQNYAALNLPTITKPQLQATGWSQTKPKRAVSPPEQSGSDEPRNLHQQEPPRPEQETEDGLLLDEGGNYYLVVSTLTTLQQVQAFKRSHPDLSASMRIMRPNGKLYRIYVARSYSPAHLTDVRNRLPDGYDDAWVCH